MFVFFLVIFGLQDFKVINSKFILFKLSHGIIRSEFTLFLYELKIDW